MKPEPSLAPASPDEPVRVRITNFPGQRVGCGTVLIAIFLSLAGTALGLHLGRITAAIDRNTAAILATDPDRPPGPPLRGDGP